MAKYSIVVFAWLLNSYLFAQCPPGLSPGPELVINGDFSAGNTGFSTGYNYTTTNYTEGEYFVGPNVRNWNGGMVGQGDHTTGTGNALMVNGAPTAGVDIWCQTIAVTPNTQYQLSAWFTPYNSGPPYGIIQFYINGVQAGTNFTIPAGVNVWTPQYITWNSGALTSITLCIRDANIIRSANDFGIDDISFRACGCNAPVSPGTVTASPGTVCYGGFSQLAVTGSSGGTIQWQSSTDSVSYTDIPGQGLALHTTAAINQTTYYRVKVTGSCNADSSATAVVRVLPLPYAGTVSIQPDTVCARAVVALHCSNASGFLVKWQVSLNGSNFVDMYGADSFYYQTPPVWQTTGFRLIVSNGVCQDTSLAYTLVVHPQPLPPVLSATDTLICSSDSARITATGAFAAYTWNTGDTGSSISVKVAGTYRVSVTDANGCSAVSGRTAIRVYPVSSVSITVLGDTLTSYNAQSYQWYFNGSLIPGATCAVYVPVESGYYAVEITDINGCRFRSTDVLVTKTVGIPGITGNNRLLVYPNPFTNSLFISAAGTSAPVPRIEVLDVLGQLVFAKNNITLPLQLSLPALAPGVYYLKAVSPQAQAVYTLIKQ